GGIAKNRGAGESNRPLPFRNKESAAGVSLRAGLVVVMAAQGLFNFAKRLRPFCFCLPFPVECEPLPAHAATGLDLLVAALAKHLHLGPPLLLPLVVPAM